MIRPVNGRDVSPEIGSALSFPVIFGEWRDVVGAEMFDDVVVQPGVEALDIVPPFLVCLDPSLDNLAVRLLISEI